MMKCKNLLIPLSLILLLPTPMDAQQPNRPLIASMLASGSPVTNYPIAGVTVSPGVPQTLTFEGSGNSPFVLFGGSLLLNQGVSLPAFSGDILDVNITAGFGILLDGTSNPFATIGSLGPTLLNVMVPPGAPLLTSAAFQCAILSPAQLTPRLTAATQVVVRPAPISLTLPTSPNGTAGLPGIFMDLTPYGRTFAFYGVNYTGFFVHADGFLSFNTNAGDFTPTEAELRYGEPRIAAMWTDLEPQYGASATTVIIDQTLAITNNVTATVNWTNMAEFSDGGTRHTFQALLDLDNGDIGLSWDVLNGAMLYPEIVGISPGGNRLPSNGQWPMQRDFSTFAANPVTGQINEAFWELFGTTTMYFYSSNVSNPWDLAGSRVRFSARSLTVAADAYTAN